MRDEGTAGASPALVNFRLQQYAERVRQAQAGEFVRLIECAIDNSPEDAPAHIVLRRLSEVVRDYYAAPQVIEPWPSNQGWLA